MNYSQSVILPTEFLLAVECCRWAFAPGQGDAVVELSSQVDWDRFAAVVRRHRIEGLVWHSLNGLGVQLPDPVTDHFSNAARAIAEHGLRAAAESARLLSAFGQAGLAPLFIKGLTLGTLAYGNPFVKMSWDLDILVPLDAIPEAAELLGAMGYRLVLPVPGDQHALSAWHARRKESVWFNAEQQIHLELHGRLAENPRLICGLGVNSPRQLVEVAPGMFLPTLAHDEMIAYLCVHGAGSAWHRLKWLSDLAALLDELTVAEIERVHVMSVTLGAGIAAGQALLLCHMLFGTEVGDKLEQRLADDRTNRWLVRIALRYLIGGPDQKDPTETRLGTVMIHAAHLLLAPGWTAKWRELRRKARDTFPRHRASTDAGAE